MWGGYFLPRWINRHEESSTKAGERYQGAMRLLSEGSSPFSPEFMDPSDKRRLVNQRRSIFSALTFLTLASCVAASVGMMAWSILAIPVSGFALYIIAVRRQIITTELKAHRLNTLQKIMTAELKVDPSVRMRLSAQPDTAQHWIPMQNREDREDPSGVVVIPKDRAGWKPTSIPRPTYATAPKAITPKRTIDLTVPGQWSAEQELLNQLLVTNRDELFDQDLLDEAARPHNIESEAI